MLGIVAGPIRTNHNRNHKAKVYTVTQSNIKTDLSVYILSQKKFHVVYVLLPIYIMARCWGVACL